MTRRTRKRREGVRTSLRIPRILIVTVVALAAAGVTYWKATKWLAAYNARIAQLESEVAKADNGTNIERYMVLKRGLEIERATPMLWVLLGLLLLVLVTALIIMIWNAKSNDDVHERSAKRWIVIMEERREARSRQRPPTSEE